VLCPQLLVFLQSWRDPAFRFHATLVMASAGHAFVVRLLRLFIFFLFEQRIEQTIVRLACLARLAGFHHNAHCFLNCSKGGISFFYFLCVKLVQSRIELFYCVPLFLGVSVLCEIFEETFVFLTV
jgi:hypothetical protein